MNAFFQFLLNSGPMVAGFVWLFFKITTLEHKLDLNLKDLNSMLNGHDYAIKKIRKEKKGVKKRVTRLEKKVRSHHLMLIRKLDQPHEA